MDRQIYKLRLSNLSYKMYRRCKGKIGIEYMPYNHIWWLFTIESQRATDLKTTKD